MVFKSTLLRATLAGLLLSLLLVIPSPGWAEDSKKKVKDQDNKEESDESKQDDKTNKSEKEEVQTTNGLDITIVTASRHEKSEFDTPIGTTVVDKKEILEKGSRTPAEMLRNKPGIWVQKTGHRGGAPIIRGFIGNKVLYLFDSIRRNTASTFAGPNGFLNSIDALDVDRIEVIRGPGSVLYGSDAIGGVVNVISNEKPTFSDSFDFGGRIYGRYASVDQEKSSRVEAWFSNKKVYGFVGGSYRDVDDLRGGRGIGVQEPGNWREKNWDAQLNFRLAENHEVEVFVQDFSNPINRRFDRPSQFRSVDRELYGVRYRGQDLGFMQSLEATVYYHDQERFTDDTKRDSSGNDETFGFDIQATSSPMENLLLTYGGHFNQDDIEKSDPQRNREDPSVDWDNWALFMLSEWQVTDRLRLDAGIRWDRTTLESSAPPINKLAQEIQDAINNGSFSLSALELNETHDAFTGGIGVVYSVTDWLNLTGHVGRAYRAPNKSDMLGFGQFTQGFSVPGGGEVDPESSLTYEVGLRVQRSDLAASLTYFNTRISDGVVQLESTFGGASFIDANGNGSQDSDEQVFKKQNVSGKLKTEGIEFEARYFVPERFSDYLMKKGVFSVNANFTWMNASSTGSEELLGNANGVIPTNALFGIRWDNDRDPAKQTTWLQFNTHFVGKFDDATDTDLAKDPAFFVDPQDKSTGLLRADGSIPGYTTFDIYLGHKFSKQGTFTLGVENITNKKYRNTYSRIDAPGLNAVIALNWEF